MAHLLEKTRKITSILKRSEEQLQDELPYNAMRRHDEASNDGREQSRFGLQPRRNGKDHGQRQRYHAHRQPRAHVF